MDIFYTFFCGFTIGIACSTMYHYCTDKYVVAADTLQGCIRIYTSMLYYDAAKLRLRKLKNQMQCQAASGFASKVRNCYLLRVTKV